MQGWRRPRRLSRAARPRSIAGLDGAFEAVCMELCLRELASVRSVLAWPGVLPQGAHAFAIRGLPAGSVFDPSWFYEGIIGNCLFGDS